MRAWVGRFGVALLLGASASGAWAAGKPRDACFAAELTPDETIAGCNVVLSQRKRETTTSVGHAFYNRGQAYVRKGEHERGIADFSEAIRLDPSDADGFRSRGSAYDDVGKYDQALADYDQALKIDPKNVLAFAYRGITRTNTGELDQAIRDFDEAAKLDPNRALTFYSRGLAYEKKNDPARALTDLETAARLDPNDEDYQAVLKRVRALAQARPAPPVPGPAATGPAATGPASLADLEAGENAVAAVWERVPFATRHAMFVTRKADAYGDYAPRPSNVFAPGEKLLSYMEPVGYAWAPQGDGFRFGVSVDFEIVGKDGAILGGQKGILKQEFASRYRNREFFLTCTLGVDGAPAGEYVLAYTLHDLGSGRTTRVEQPFTIKAAAAAAQ